MKNQLASYVHSYLFSLTMFITCKYVTGPEKTGLIYTKYTYLYYGTYLLSCVRYPISVSCIGFFRIVCIYDEVCVKMLCCEVEILHLKDVHM